VSVALQQLHDLDRPLPTPLHRREFLDRRRSLNEVLGDGVEQCNGILDGEVHSDAEHR
jgi:hypothetical protein